MENGELRYTSTRGGGRSLDFEGVLLAGLAADGGLYVPIAWPDMTPEQIVSCTGRSYADVAYGVLRPFIGSCIAEDDLRGMIKDAYASFTHPAVAPLVQIGVNDFVLELFHGPTMAFKDVAMQLLARLMECVLTRRGEKITIIGATSGDTGAAAVEAFRGRSGMDLFILHPKGRISDVQRRQMTTVHDDYVHNIAIEGTFDDCQNIVKALFGNAGLRERLNLAGVNSINWARIIAQSVYYITASAALGAPHRKLAFAVPTGNFGDVYAGYVACRMGLALQRLIVGTNVNDILVRTLRSGRYELRDVIATHSPSMDIQLSSNFERLLFDLVKREGRDVSAMMHSLTVSGMFTLDDDVRSVAHLLFRAYSCDEMQTGMIIRDVFERTGMLIDPHTAVGVKAARDARANGDIDADTALVTLATAHPGKFPDIVEEATGVRPTLPGRSGDLDGRDERYTTLPNDIDIVTRFIEARARCQSSGVER